MRAKEHSSILFGYRNKCEEPRFTLSIPDRVEVDTLIEDSDIPDRVFIAEVRKEKACHNFK